MRSKKIFLTYSFSRLRGTGRAVESVFIRLSLLKILFAPLSLLMNKLLKFKAGDVLRNNHKLAQLYVSFRINYKFSIYNRFE